MRIDYVKRSARNLLNDPMWGITLSAQESNQVKKLVQVLSPLPRDILSVLRTALEQEVRRLEEAEEWTEHTSVADESRRDLHHQAIIAYQATDLAAGGTVRSRM